MLENILMPREYGLKSNSCAVPVDISDDDIMDPRLSRKTTNPRPGFDKNIFSVYICALCEIGIFTPDSCSVSH